MVRRGWSTRRVALAPHPSGLVTLSGVGMTPCDQPNGPLAVLRWRSSPSHEARETRTYDHWR